MRVNDPYDLAAEPQHVPDDPEPEPVPLEAHFYQDTAPQATRNALGQRLAAVQTCRVDSTGRHTLIAQDCPHGLAEDEMGPVKPRGWTVQG